MAILTFQKPNNLVQVEAGQYKGVFEFYPLEPGYGVTIGNALRRVLLSSLEGFAISAVKIDGIPHEFSTIKGVVEDVPEIVLNLKQIRIKQIVPDVDSEKVIINIAGKEKFIAEDINQFMTNFQVINSNLVICEMTPKTHLKFELIVQKGRGYVPAEENQPFEAPVGLIPIDAIFTPIRNVQYKVENYRVEQRTDYEKLILTITTDGTITPKNALKEAAKILIQHFMIFSDEKITLETFEKTREYELNEPYLHRRQILKTKLVDLQISNRPLNCLLKSNIETLGDLVAYNRDDLTKLRNFGKKSLDEIETLLRTKNLTFGMDVSKYKLDED